MSEAKRVEVLSLGHSDVECSKARWVEAFTGYTPRARYHAAMLAAHNWDVLLVDGRVFLTSYYGDRGRWLPATFGIESQEMPEATDEEMAALYDASKHPKIRLFLSPPLSPPR